MTEEVTIPKMLVAVFIIFDLIQMLVFPLSPRSSMPWASQR